MLFRNLLSNKVASPGFSAITVDTWSLPHTAARSRRSCASIIASVFERGAHV